MANKNKLSLERERELLSKIEGARAFMKRAFDIEVSDEQVISLVKAHVDQEKVRVFLKHVGTVSPADLEFLQGRLTPVKVKSDGRPGKQSASEKLIEASGTTSEEHAQSSGSKGADGEGAFPTGSEGVEEAGEGSPKGRKGK